MNLNRRIAARSAAIAAKELAGKVESIQEDEQEECGVNITCMQLEAVLADLTSATCLLQSGC